MTNTSRRRKFPHDLSRRTVLASGAAIAAAGLPLASIPNAAESRRAETAILAMVRHREAAIALGQTALLSQPHLYDSGRILADVLDDLGMDGDSAARASAGDIASRLTARIRNDFEVERTVMLDGWLLSLAETRLYALAALAEE
jgi:hypothetical protein